MLRYLRNRARLRDLTTGGPGCLAPCLLLAQSGHLKALN
jgi:hypothetical protein